MMKELIMKTLKMGLIVFGICLCAGVAYGGPITVDDTSDPIQQTENSPCVIGNPSCNQPIDFTAFELSHESEDTWAYYSPIYLVGSSGDVGPGNVIPEAFSIGFDVNYAPGQPASEYLNYFYVYLVTDPPPDPFPGSGGADAPAGGSPYPLITYDDILGWGPVAQTSGNGWSDIILRGFELEAGDYVYFRASVSGETAGFGQFFIKPEGSTPVPEPTTLILLGLGLAGVAVLSRKVRNR
jgi:hypothetical protein